MSKQFKHILVIRFSAMGDVAMTVPVLRALTQNHPKLKITILTRPFFKPFFSDFKNVSVLEAELNGKHKGLIGLYKLSKTLKTLDIDCVADLHNVLRTKILKLFLGALPIKQINKGRSDKRALVSGKLFKQLKSTHQRYADVFEDLGFKIDLSNPSFPPKRHLTERSQRIVGSSKPLIGIAPFAAFEGKAYPLNMMEIVIENLKNEHHVILLGGGSKEIEKLNQIASKYDNVTNIAGQLDLKEELDVISNLELLISMDSGNAHLGAMLGIKVLSIWGVTHPFAGFYPFNQDPKNALLANRDQFDKIPTSVYGKNHPTGYEKAIETISPEAILSKTKELLNR